jgi:hypothetical protein
MCMCYISPCDLPRDLLASLAASIPSCQQPPHSTAVPSELAATKMRKHKVTLVIIETD